ncbi:MAG: hypothetical protein HUU55_19225 [Myxococcales bacterium]|nr:hypothetical protein [Myxococcales bacterium]
MTQLFRILPSALLILVLSSSVASSEPLNVAKDALESGNLTLAETTLKGILAKSANSGDALSLMTLLYRTWGKWDDARKAAQALAKSPGWEQEAAVAHAEIDLATGRYDKVVTALSPLIRADKPQCALRWALGRAYLATGRTTDAFDVLDPMADFYLDSQITTAADLTYLGQALRSLGHFKNANDIFSEAAKADQTYLPALLGWGELFLSKYNYRDADHTFKDVLKQNPKEPMALVGMARIDIDSDNDPSKALERAQEVLNTIPNHTGALRVVSTVHRYNERYDDALVAVQTALRANPNDLDSLAELAAVYYLQDNSKAFQETVDRALAIHPRFAQIYAFAANAGERVHRYKEGIALFERALLLDPDLPDAHIGLGIGYSRMGNDEKAEYHLNLAHSLDPYNVRVFNLASIFYDSMIQEFELRDYSGLRFRFHKSEKEVLEHFVAPAVADGKLALDKRYRFEPEGPVQVEIFPDERLFSIRTVGLPRMAAHGVCFGKLVTARSPSEGNFNWRQVLYHELAHIYHIQLSQSRVPRWFTEGLAVHETRVLRSQWDQPMKIEMARAIRLGRVIKVGQFNQAFTLARSFEDILLAYYQASLVAQFIDETWGFEALRSMLVAWGDKKTTPEVVRAVLSVDTEELDARFLQWVKGKLSAYMTTYEPYVADYSDLARHKSAADNNPADAQLRAEFAMAQLAKGDSKAAHATFLEAVQIDASNRLANYMLGQLALSADNTDMAITYLQEAVLGDSESISARLSLAQALITQGKSKEATQHFESVLSIDPGHTEALVGLATIAMSSPDEPDTWQILGRAADADQKNAKLAILASQGAGKANNIERMAHYANLALEIAPFNGEVVAALATTKLAQGQAQQALSDLSMIVDSVREQKERALVALAHVKLQLGDNVGAKDALDKALKAIPNDSEALELMRRLQ